MTYKKKKRFKQGIYKPMNPNKYMGKKTIVYRSSWERKFCIYCDMNNNILEWSSEELIIPYVGIDKRNHRYYPDFLIKYKSVDGKIKKLLIEVKPEAQTQLPKQNSKFYGDSIQTFLTNQKKWDAAKKFANKNAMGFMILTEKTITKLK